MPSIYLDRYAYPKIYLNLDQISDPGIIVVIPCFNEPDLLSSLQALENCGQPSCSVIIITVINAGTHSAEGVKSHNQKTYDEACLWATSKRKYE